jgi:hypothetical protein
MGTYQYCWSRNTRRWANYCIIMSYNLKEKKWQTRK